MEQRHQLGLDSYDRFFPSQDTMPRGGFGNLIALPLQHLPRGHGNSVFLDADFNPHPDQWALLSSVRRITFAEVESVVREAERCGDLIGVRRSVTDDEQTEDPWTLPPSRKKKDEAITITVSYTVDPGSIPGGATIRGLSPAGVRTSTIHSARRFAI